MIYISSACIKSDKISESISILAESGFRKIELSGGTKYYKDYEKDLVFLQQKYNLNYLVHNYFPPPEEPFVLNLASTNDHIYHSSIELYKKAIDSGNPFEVVILDLTVKRGLGGKDAVKKILEIDPQAKAIVSSGYSNDPVITHFREYGFIEALPKPYTVKGLRDALNKITKK